MSLRVPRACPHSERSRALPCGLVSRWRYSASAAPREHWPGPEILLELIPEGGFDGLLSVAGRRGHFTEADDDSVVASLALPSLERVIALEPRVASNLFQLIIERLEGREEHLEAVVLHDPSQRLGRQLLALGETLGRMQGNLGGTQATVDAPDARRHARYATRDRDSSPWATHRDGGGVG